MIDPSTAWGRAMIVFFWGGLSASIVNMAWVFFRFNPVMIAWLVVLVNMVAVHLKNVLIPPKK